MAKKEGVRVLEAPSTGSEGKDWSEEEPIGDQGRRYRHFLWKEASPTRGAGYERGEPHTQRVSHTCPRTTWGIVEMPLTTD